VRKRIDALLEVYRQRLSQFFPGDTQEEKVAKCRLLFPSSVRKIDRGWWPLRK
jgi:hypothetical protein